MRIIRVVRRFGEKVEESKVHYANARAACYRYAIDLEFPIRCVSNRVIIADRYVQLAAHWLAVYPLHKPSLDRDKTGISGRNSSWSLDKLIGCSSRWSFRFLFSAFSGISTALQCRLMSKNRAFEITQCISCLRQTCIFKSFLSMRSIFSSTAAETILHKIVIKKMRLPDLLYNSPMNCNSKINNYYCRIILLSEEKIINRQNIVSARTAKIKKINMP